MMSTAGQKRSVASAARHVWQLGQFRAFYRGLGVSIPLCFALFPPNSTIDWTYRGFSVCHPLKCCRVFHII